MLLSLIALAACDAGVLVDETSSSVADDGFPCEVRAVLEDSCAPCHAGTMYVRELKTRAAWVAPSGADMTVGQHAAMQVADRKMPPANAAHQPTDGDRAILLDWVAAGMPAGACAALTPPAL